MKAKLFLPIFITIMVFLWAQVSAQITEYVGMCDASAALAIDDQHFIIANDEDNMLRVYHIDKKMPVSTYDLSAFMRIRYDDKSPESDIEGATRLGDYYFFITSHGRDRKGRLRRNRHQFFAVQVDPQSYEIAPVGSTYGELMDDLMHVGALKKVNIYDAFQPDDSKDDDLAPKERGVNIEGLAAAADGALLIGFRNPIPDDRALIVLLLNPFEVIARTSAPKFGSVFFMDMDGRGVRSLEYHPGLDQYLIVGGSRNGDMTSKIYRWDGRENSKLIEIKDVDFTQFKKFNPEAITIYSADQPLQIYSDDGTVMFRDRSGDKCECKDLEDARDKQYRAMWIDPEVLRIRD